MSKKLFSINNIIIYFCMLMISKVGFVDNIPLFGMAGVAAACSNRIPLAPIFLVCGIGTYLGFGQVGLLTYIVSFLIFIFFTLVVKPKEDENGKIRLGIRLVLSIILVQCIGLFVNGLLVYDIVANIIFALSSLIFYKIFENSIIVIRDYSLKEIFTSEEIVGATLLLAIVISAVPELHIYGVSLRVAIATILIVVVGIGQGMLIGSTAGITIALIMGILGNNDIVLIPTFAILGLVAGLLSRIKDIKINEIYEDSFPALAKLRLSDGTKKEDNKAETRLNAISEIVTELAKSYGEVATTDLEEECKGEHYSIVKEDKVQNFIMDLINNLEGYDNNILYYDVLEDNPKIVYEIYEFLEAHKTLRETDLLNILENNDKYIIIGESKEIELYLQILVDTINYTFRIGTSNTLVRKRTNENKKIIKEQLTDVSKIIADVATNLQKEGVGVEAHGDPKEEKLELKIGVSRTTKASSKVSGDSYTISKLEDEKTLIVLSDGMGSGEIAESNSKLVVRMLEKMLNNGFNKEVALKLINSSLILSAKEEGFATVDTCIIDSYNKNAEFIKIGACPTYIKRENGVELVKSETLPVGILNNIDIDMYTREISKGDIIVMCTDGAIESYNDIEEKEMWIKNLLENMKTKNAQKIADIIISEAIDNAYGGVKDDISVIVAIVE